MVGHDEAEHGVALYDFQARAVGDVFPRLRGGQRVVLVSPTGSGKTVMGSSVVAEWTRKCNAGRVLWLAHRVELLSQAERSLVTAGASGVAILSGESKPADGWRVLVASIDSVRVGTDLSGVTLVVVDEAHRTLAKSYRRIVDERLAGIPVLGLTATPWRLDGRGVGDVYTGGLVLAATPSALIEAKRATQPKVFTVNKQRHEDIVSGVKTNAGEYDEAEVSKRMIVLAGNVVEERARHAAGLPTICFAVNRAHAKELARRFAESGVTTGYIDGQSTKAERKAATDGIANGSIEVLVSVDVLTEGFDVPSVRCISYARPTKSLTRWLQGCGRAARYHDGTRAVILDHAGNIYRHGLPTDDREWSLEDREKGDSTGSAHRQCPSCELAVPIGCVACPECGIELSTPEKTVAELERERLEEARTATCKNCRAKFHVPPSHQGHLVNCRACRRRPGQTLRLSVCCQSCGVAWNAWPSEVAAGVKNCGQCRRPKSPKGHRTNSARHCAERRKRDGICRNCALPVHGNTTLCEHHLVRLREKVRAFRHRLRGAA